ncbi:MAG: hypothetical protein AB2669_20585 [Candidatus Thiodiazotropha endolucinida]|uniref:Uncharacterized protein n=2 Tax=Candidatus Thiodiazotropha TaxID=1913444 RepID=A0A7Z1AEN1_9GAMM|nr:hypothetical protein [Candidatus Thiodiazotropha endolucinida]MBT3015730.1 hypothetical protein [Candidatus Thiodiazotropha taylori]MBT3039565.1 hypothetical protein [Candidatus Thiodiazotropha sp. (ex Codakia orbicularis)]MBT3041881.1 hypothetical protein [Candidatus Thiodiazotropha sp. (ex Codakia orbicularis)]MBV2124742.1 hypothetical protein [Candidatus Thiodiazotropha taylori]MCG7860780.1 hypothetical protein [Candidatus Thiodiazotropha endolucinida]
MSMKEAVRQIGQHANMMPVERGITLPMVKLENNRVIVRRLIYFTRTTPEYGTAITEPQYVAIYDLTGTTFITLKRFEMDVPNLRPPPWIHNRPAFEKPEDIIPEFERIWTLYDMLIPAFLKGDAGISAEIKQAAKQYVHYFDRHAEKPLLPFYDVFGGDFLHWVGRAANS